MTVNRVFSTSTFFDVFKWIFTTICNLPGSYANHGNSMDSSFMQETSCVHYWLERRRSRYLNVCTTTSTNTTCTMVAFKSIEREVINHLSSTAMMTRTHMKHAILSNPKLPTLEKRPRPTSYKRVRYVTVLLKMSFILLFCALYSLERSLNFCHFGAATSALL